VILRRDVGQDDFGEVGEGVELVGGERVDEPVANVVHVAGRGRLDGLAARLCQKYTTLG
jgi:hypothetical protein